MLTSRVCTKAIPDNGSGVDAITEGGKGISRLIARYDETWMLGHGRSKTAADNRDIAMTASQMRIAETIDAFYGDAGAKDGVSRSYKQAVEDLDSETIKALDGPYRTTVLEPISRFCAYFPDVNECARFLPSRVTAFYEQLR